jgi:hypothetical protein
MTDRYTKMARQIEHRKHWADLAGIGFEIPERKFLDEEIQEVEAETERSPSTSNQNDQQETHK